LREHHRLVESGERAIVARADENLDEGLARATDTIDAFYELPYRARADGAEQRRLSDERMASWRCGRH
jgi:hypothetical protein